MAPRPEDTTVNPLKSAALCTCSLQPGSGDALIVVDVQNDFLPRGALAVNEGDAILPVLNRYLGEFERRGLPIFATRLASGRSLVRCRQPLRNVRRVLWRIRLQPFLRMWELVCTSIRPGGVCR
jgi:hypothetical protein